MCLFAGTWSGAVLLEILTMPLLSRIVSKGMLALIVVVLIYCLAICSALLGVFLKMPEGNPASPFDDPFFNDEPTVC
jgi:hypothetical protein